MQARTIIFATLVVMLVAVTASAEDDTVRRAYTMIQDGKHDQAIELLNGYLQQETDDAEALIALASVYHAQGEYKKAVDANRRAATTRWAAPTARYNEACALSLLGRADDANRALKQAMEAGFLDYDLIATDSDLDNLRAKHKIAMPPVNKYTDFIGRNGVKLAYKVITPDGYDKKKTYPALLLFAAGNGTHSADWAMQNLVGPGDTRDWIVVYPIASERGWFTHPSHHALNEMLDEVRESYEIEGNKFHLSGFGEGARAASTYSQMSKEYFLTLTTFSAWHWNRWDDDDLADGFGMPVRLVVGEKDEMGYDMNQHAKALMGDRDVVFEVVATDDHRLASIRGGRLVEYIPYKESPVSRP